MSRTANVPLLIVDDDAPIRKLLERVALRSGFDVDCARDGIEALEMIGKKDYAIAIIDLMMPRMSGYDLVQKISAMPTRPVIMVATAMANADVSKIDDTLVRRVIRKPFDVSVVAEALIDAARNIADQKAPPNDAQVIRLSAQDLAKQIADEVNEKKQSTDEADTDSGRPANR